MLPAAVTEASVSTFLNNKPDGAATNQSYIDAAPAALRLHELMEPIRGQAAAA